MQPHAWRSTTNPATLSGANVSEGLVFDIQRFSTNGGPGMRTVVFLKGCPLSCKWCQNPEGINPNPEVLYRRTLCLSCGLCAARCRNSVHSLQGGVHMLDRSKCEHCMRCAETCPSGALEISGKSMTAEEVFSAVMEDKFLLQESGGGLTLSGGDPLLQFEFTQVLLRLARSHGIHTCLDTTGWGDVLLLEALQPTVDLFLWSVRDTDDLRHEVNTGVSLQRILGNLLFLDRLGARTRLRSVIIRDVTLREPHIDRLAQIYRSLRNCEGIELLPYSPRVESRAQRLGLTMPALSTTCIPSPEEMEAARTHLEHKWRVPVLR